MEDFDFYYADLPDAGLLDGDWPNDQELEDDVNKLIYVSRISGVDVTRTRDGPDGAKGSQALHPTKTAARGSKQPGASKGQQATDAAPRLKQAAAGPQALDSPPQQIPDSKAGVRMLASQDAARALLFFLGLTFSDGSWRPISETVSFTVARVIYNNAYSFFTAGVLLLCSRAWHSKPGRQVRRLLFRGRLGARIGQPEAVKLRDLFVWAFIINACASPFNPALCPFDDWVFAEQDDSALYNNPLYSIGTFSRDEIGLCP